MPTKRYETLLLFALGLLTGAALTLPLALFPYQIVEPLLRVGLVMSATAGALLVTQWLWERNR